MSAPRRAQIVATSVEVRCPYCGEPQPDCHGSLLWLPGQVSKLADVERRRLCFECDRHFLLVPATKVRVEMGQ